MCQRFLYIFIQIWVTAHYLIEHGWSAHKYCYWFTQEVTWTNHTTSRLVILDNLSSNPPNFRRFYLNSFFLELTGLTKEEFYTISESHAISPWKFKGIQAELGTKLPDFKAWSRDGKMKREDAEVQIDKWKKSK